MHAPVPSVALYEPGEHGVQATVPDAHASTLDNQIDFSATLMKDVLAVEGFTREHTLRHRLTDSVRSGELSKWAILTGISIRILVLA